ncbi:agmatine deiminase family protein [Klugiella xanthotipulae]|nr:agmatine deiminase family protein [Klugiella xanthotipulae]
MPHEGAPHERTWLAWPTAGYALGSSEVEREEAQRTWSAVANAVSEFEPVSMVCNPGDEAVARRLLSGSVALHSAPLNDAWMRDIGPSFVLSPEGTLGAVDWTFNGWGEQEWAQWDKDSQIARYVAEWSGAELVPSRLVNEGGGIQVDGEGTVLLTQTVQCDPHRNPGKTRTQIERELARTIGATNAIWFDRGLTRDSEALGTRGHADLLAAFARPGLVFVHDQQDAGHPDSVVSRELHHTLQEATDAHGQHFELVSLPAPRNLRDAGGYVDHSYVNHLVVNGGVIACGFNDPHDEVAAGILREHYEGREVVTVDARALFDRGGGIHCITQQQPVSR